MDLAIRQAKSKPSLDTRNPQAHNTKKLKSSKKPSEETQQHKEHFESRT